MTQTSKSSAKNRQAPSVKDLSVEQRRFALIKQKQCDSIALHIVTKLIDCKIEEDVFLLSLKYLNQSHYEDVVEERAIDKLCGYPVCGNSIADMPQKKFHISSKLNKVYDITDRKHYCSNFCYKAASYIKDQMLTSPLWFRDKEQIPEFHLLPKTVPGIPGIEIDQGIAKVDSDEPNFIPVTTFALNVLDDITENINETINVECKLAPNIQTQNNNTNITQINTNITEHNTEKLETKTNRVVQIPKIAAKFQNQTVNKKKAFDRTIINTEPTRKTDFENEPNQNVETLSIKITKSKEIKTKIGFDRTIINNAKVKKIDDHLISNFENVKSILSTSKKSMDDPQNVKKSVSFSKETKPETNDNTIFGYNTNKNKQKYKVSIIDDTDEVPTMKNINLIGDVQEVSKINNNNTIIKNKPKYIVTNIDEINVINDVTTDVVLNTTKNINLIGNVQDASKYYKNDISTNDKENCSLINNLDNNKNNTTDENKHKRLDRLKNSATYKRNHHTKMIQKPAQIISDFTKRLISSIEKWVTLETIIFLYGEERVRQIISDSTFKKFVNKRQALNLDDAKQKKYVDLCKRLNLAELADRQFDESVTGKKRLPLPKFEELKTQAESMNLKVQAFYSGCYELIEEDEDSETESMKEEVGEEKEGTPAVLPLVESKDIGATRRKIFLTSLSRTLPSTCEILKQCPNYLLSDIKQLIDTFAFTADNIVFKSSEWKFVAFILIKMLAIRDDELQQELTSADAQSYLISLKKEFFISDINEFLVKIIEIPKFLEDYSKNFDY